MHPYVILISKNIKRFRTILTLQRIAYVVLAFLILLLVDKLFVPSGFLPKQKSVEKIINVPIEEIESLVASDLPFYAEELVRPSDTLVDLMKRVGVADTDAQQKIMTNPLAQEVIKQLRAGRSIVLAMSHQGQLLKMIVPVGSSDENLLIERHEDDFLFTKEHSQKKNNLYTEMKSATIKSSLFAATDAAHIPENIASKMAEIFGTSIDFTKDLRKGDKFSVIYERDYKSGGAKATGKILAARFVNQGKAHTVVLYRNNEGKEAYYKPDGRSLGGGFLRYPLEFTRVSSSFGRRHHPIKKVWKNHTGTDLAAAMGTPIKAASDGVVKFKGMQRGYGNVVILQHIKGYSTLYAHMRNFGNIQQGQQVQQGQTIGYVGMTGWATGPHLHYEVRINNVPYDPIKVALPMDAPLEKRQLTAFFQQTKPFLQNLALLNRHKTREFISRLTKKDLKNKR